MSSFSLACLLRKSSLISRDLLRRGMRFTEEFYDWLASIGCDYIGNTISYECIFVILSDTTTSIGGAFCYSPLYTAVRILRTLFFICE